MWAVLMQKYAGKYAKFGKMCAEICGKYAKYAAHTQHNFCMCDFENVVICGKIVRYADFCKICKYLTVYDVGQIRRNAEKCDRICGDVQRSANFCICGIISAYAILKMQLYVEKYMRHADFCKIYRMFAYNWHP